MAQDEEQRHSERIRAALPPRERSRVDEYFVVFALLLFSWWPPVEGVVPFIDDLILNRPFPYWEIFALCAAKLYLIGFFSEWFWGLWISRTFRTMGALVALCLWGASVVHFYRTDVMGLECPAFIYLSVHTTYSLLATHQERTENGLRWLINSS